MPDFRHISCVTLVTINFQLDLTPMAHETTTIPDQPVYGVPKPIHVHRTGVNVGARQGLAATGLALIVLSLPVGLLTPGLPLGLPMAVVGTVLLSRNAVWGRRWLETFIARNPAIESHTPSWLVKSVLGRSKRVFAG